MIRSPIAVLTALAIFRLVPAVAETTECTEITSIPTVITVQGVYCLKQDLSTDIDVGSAIDIQTNNVTVDLNGHTLAGSGYFRDDASGIYSLNRKNITIRNGTITGFRGGVIITATSYNTGDTTGILIHNLNIQKNFLYGVFVRGRNVYIKDNIIAETTTPFPKPIGYALVADAKGLVHIDNNKIFNTIGRIDQTLESKMYGIYAYGQNNPAFIIENNEILDVSNSQGHLYIGIGNIGSSPIVLKDNILINPASDIDTSSGIEIEYLTSARVNCTGNVAIGFFRPKFLNGASEAACTDADNLFPVPNAD